MYYDPVRQGYIEEYIECTVDEGGHADQDEKNVFHFDPEEAEADEDVHNGCLLYTSACL